MPTQSSWKPVKVRQKVYLCEPVAGGGHEVTEHRVAQILDGGETIMVRKRLADGDYINVDRPPSAVWSSKRDALLVAAEEDYRRGLILLAHSRELMVAAGNCRG